MQKISEVDIRFKGWFCQVLQVQCNSWAQVPSIHGEIMVAISPVFQLGSGLMSKQKTAKVAIFRTRCGKCANLERGLKHGEWKCEAKGNYWYRYEVIRVDFASLCDKFRPLEKPRAKGGKK